MPRPWISGVASLIIPGLGQVLNGKYLRGGTLMIGWIVAAAVTMVASIAFFMLVHLVFILTTAVDAYRVAKSKTTMTVT